MPNLVATFNASTGWAGKTVTYEAGQFLLEGHGPITAADVLRYFANRQIDWAGPEVGGWVSQQVGNVQPTPWADASPQAKAPARAAARAVATSPARSKGRAWNQKVTWKVWVLLAVVVLAAAAVMVTQNHSNANSPKQTAVATINGIGMPDSTSDSAFNANMASTPDFHADGKVVATAAFFSETSTDGACVQGYLMPANVPNDPSRYDAAGDEFTIPYAGQLAKMGTSYEWDNLHGDYYLVAAGQDCNWGLTVHLQQQ